MFGVINGSIVNNFTTIQELWRTPENSKGQQNVLSRIKDISSFDSKFKERPWRSRTSGNLKRNAYITALTLCIRVVPVSKIAISKAWPLKQSHCAVIASRMSLHDLSAYLSEPCRSSSLQTHKSRHSTCSWKASN